MYSLSNEIDPSFLPLSLVERYRLADAAALKVALFMILNKHSDSMRISTDLNIPIEKVEKSLKFWTDCGFLVCENPNTQMQNTKPQTVVPDKTEDIQKEYSIFEVEKTLLRNPEISLLFQEAQRYLGRTISDSETSRLFTMYMSFELPVDVLLMIIAYSKKRAKRSLFNYIEKICRSWKDEGINCAEKAEKHLKLLEKRERREIKIARILDVEPDSFKYKDKERITKWYEEFGFTSTLIEEAQKYCNEEQKHSVAYINSILQDWHKKGVKTVADTRNKQPSNAPAPVPKVDKNKDSLIKRAVKKQI